MNKFEHSKDGFPHAKDFKNLRSNQRVLLVHYILISTLLPPRLERRIRRPLKTRVLNEMTVFLEELFDFLKFEGAVILRHNRPRGPLAPSYQRRTVCGLSQ